MPVGRTYDRAFNNSCTWQLLRKIALGLSGGTYPAALRDLAFQLCLPQLALSFCFVF